MQKEGESFSTLSNTFRAPKLGQIDRAAKLTQSFVCLEQGSIKQDFKALFYAPNSTKWPKYVPKNPIRLGPGGGNVRLEGHFLPAQHLSTIIAFWKIL